MPGFNGSTDLFGQSAVLDLYDPDRSKVVLKASDRGKDYTEQTLGRFLEGASTTAEDDYRRRRRRAGHPGRAEHLAHARAPARRSAEAIPEAALGRVRAVGRPTPPSPTISSKADVIVSLDADFLGASEGTVQTIAGFAAGRRRLGKTQETMSRLYVVEGRFSLTGGMADHRLRDASSSIGAVATLLAAQARHGRRIAGNSFAAFSDPNVDAWITEMAKDLANAKGRVARHLRQPAAARSAGPGRADQQGARQRGHHLSRTASSRTPTRRASAISPAQISRARSRRSSSSAAIRPSTRRPISASTNSSAKVEQVIRLGLHVDETSAASTTHLPAAHFLESWGDSLAYDSTTYLCQQPLILPLYGGISELDLLAALAGLPKAKGPEYVQETFADRHRHRPGSPARAVRQTPGTSSSTTASSLASQLPDPRRTATAC